MSQYGIFDTCDALIAFLRAGMTVTGWPIQLGDVTGVEVDKFIFVYPVSDDEAADAIGAVNYVETQTIQCVCAIRWADTRVNMDALRNVVEDIKSVIRADATGRRLNVVANIEEVSVRTIWGHESLQSQGYRAANCVLTCTVAPGA